MGYDWGIINVLREILNELRRISAALEKMNKNNEPPHRDFGPL